MEKFTCPSFYRNNYMGVNDEVTAGDPQTDPKALAMMAYDPSPSIREAIASNPSTPSLVFDVLVKDNLEIRRALSSNIALVEPFITHLILDNDDPYIIYALANNPALESDHLRTLSEKFAYLELALIGNAKSPEDVLRNLYILAIEKRLQDENSSPEFTEKVELFISNPSTPLDILAKIALDNPQYQKKIVENVIFVYPIFQNMSHEDILTTMTRRVTPIY